MSVFTLHQVHSSEVLLHSFIHGTLPSVPARNRTVVLTGALPPVSVDKEASDRLVLVMAVTNKSSKEQLLLPIPPSSVHTVRSQQLTVLGCCLLTKSEIKSNSFCPRKSSGSSCTLSNPSSITSDVKTSSSIKSASMPLRLRAGPAICCMLLSWA